MRQEKRIPSHRPVRLLRHGEVQDDHCGSGDSPADRVDHDYLIESREAVHHDIHVDESQDTAAGKSDDGWHQ